MSRAAQLFTMKRDGVLRLTLAGVALLAMIATPAAQAQTFHVIHAFGGSVDGSNPISGVTIDPAGNLYGTTYFGGTGLFDQGQGIVFKLAQKNSSWILTPLYNFQSGNDGANPVAPPVIGQNGALYGTTQSGAGSLCYLGLGCGTVYELQPPAGICTRVSCPWNENVLHRFTGAADGGNPGYGALTFDAAGNIYGTTAVGGDLATGVVYELTGSGGHWTEKVLYTFDEISDGVAPGSSVIFDSQGNLYGTATAGGSSGHGTVYKLTPSGLSNWTISLLHDFTTDGWFPLGGVFWDNAGNLFGATAEGGPGGGGDVFELTPSGSSWTFNQLYTFPEDREGPLGAMAMDAAGNLYGTTMFQGTHERGTVFKLTLSNGTWVHSILHDFTGGSDGCYPNGGVSLDRNGNLFGTAYSCGDWTYGVVWEITPN